MASSTAAAAAPASVDGDNAAPAPQGYGSHAQLLQQRSIEEVAADTAAALARLADVVSVAPAASAAGAAPGGGGCAAFRELAPEPASEHAVELARALLRSVPQQKEVLHRPPFRFIFDVVAAATALTGFAAGLYAGPERDCAALREKFGRDAKLLYLRKLIALATVLTGEKLPAKAHKIVAGVEPAATCALLGAVAQAARISAADRAAHAAAVARIIAATKEEWSRIYGAPLPTELAATPALHTTGARHAVASRPASAKSFDDATLSGTECSTANGQGVFEGPGATEKPARPATPPRTRAPSPGRNEAVPKRRPQSAAARLAAGDRITVVNSSRAAALLGLIETDSAASGAGVALPVLDAAQSKAAIGVSVNTRPTHHQVGPVRALPSTLGPISEPQAVPPGRTALLQRPSTASGHRMAGDDGSSFAPGGRFDNASMSRAASSRAARPSTASLRPTTATAGAAAAATATATADDVLVSIMGGAASARTGDALALAAAAGDAAVVCDILVPQIREARYADAVSSAGSSSIVAASVDVNEPRGPAAFTPLHSACMQGRVEVASLLVLAGADPNARTTDARTPLHVAAGLGMQTETRTAGSSNVRADQHAVNSVVRLVELLCAAGADVNARDEYQQTPLMLAAAKACHASQAGVVRALLRWGADPLARDRFDDAAADVAGCREVVDVLREAAAATETEDARLELPVQLGVPALSTLLAAGVPPWRGPLLLLNVFTYLPGADVARCALVCGMWRRIVTEEGRSFVRKQGCQYANEAPGSSVYAVVINSLLRCSQGMSSTASTSRERAPSGDVAEGIAGPVLSSVSVPGRPPLPAVTVASNRRPRPLLAGVALSTAAAIGTTSGPVVAVTPSFAALPSDPVVTTALAERHVLVQSDSNPSQARVRTTSHTDAGTNVSVAAPATRPIAPTLSAGEAQLRQLLGLDAPAVAATVAIVRPPTPKSATASRGSSAPGASRPNSAGTAP